MRGALRKALALEARLAQSQKDMDKTNPPRKDPEARLAEYRALTNAEFSEQDQDLIREYDAKVACAAKSRAEGSYALTQAFERQALDRLEAMSARARNWIHRR